MVSEERGPDVGTRVAVVALLVYLVSAWIGIVTASAVGSLGPHRAVYEITGSSSGIVDLGPLGTLEVDSPVPLRLGVRVTVQEIPGDVTSIDAPATLEGLSADLDRYVQFFTSPMAFLQDAARDLAWSAVRHTAIAFAAFSLAIAGLYLLLGKARRREITEALVRRRRTSIAGVVAAVTLGLTVVASGPLGPDLAGSQPASRIFDGTPLEGARLTGRLAGIVDTYGAQALDAYRENEAFYSGAEESLRSAWAAREELSEDWARLLEQSERVSPLQRVMLAEPEKLVTVLLVSDLHCNVGMAPVLSAAVELAGAQVVLDAGDTTVNGTAVERYCVTAFANAYRSGGAREIIFAGGNHDSATTAEQVRAAGGTVLAGELVDVAGIEVLGDHDPFESRIGQGTRLAGEESVAAMGSRLAELACSRETPVPILLIHNPAVGDEILERGCAVAQLSGHMHRWAGPQRTAQGVRLVNGSTAGAVSGAATVGPLGGTATFAVLRVSPEYGLVADYRKVTIDRKGEAEVGWWMPFPLPAGMLPPPVEQGLPEGAV